MLAAAGWGFLGGFALLLGALIALRVKPSPKTNAFVMAFGAGVLISAVSFDLTEEAINIGGGGSAALGLAAGALTFFIGDRLLDGRGGRDRKRSGGQQADGDPQGIVLGALLDGIPESAAIGLTLIGGGSISVSFIVAVFISNLPESISATTGLAKAGHSPRWIALLWLAVCVASAIAAGLGYRAARRRLRRHRRLRQDIRRRRDPLHARRHDDARGLRERRQPGRPRDRPRLRARGAALDRLAPAERQRRRGAGYALEAGSRSASSSARSAPDSMPGSERAARAS